MKAVMSISTRTDNGGLHPAASSTPGRQAVTLDMNWPMRCGHFFLPHRYRDAFGNATRVVSDGHDLAPTETTDAVGNTARAELDYRVLAPQLLTDLNGNRSEVAFDALGLVAGTAVMGKTGKTRRCVGRIRARPLPAAIGGFPRRSAWQRYAPAGQCIDAYRLRCRAILHLGKARLCRVDRARDACQRSSTGRAIENATRPQLL